MEDLGSGVSGGAENDAFGLFEFDGVCEAKVSNLWRGVHIEEDIGWLDVAVDDAATVCVGEATGDGGDEVESDGWVDGLLMGRVIEGLSLHELHDNIEHSLNVAEVVDRDKVGVIEAGHRLGLGFKRGAELGVIAELAGEDFDGDVAIEGFLACFINRAHTALGDECFEHVGGEEGRQLLKSGRDKSGGRRWGFVHGLSGKE